MACKHEQFNAGFKIERTKVPNRFRVGVVMVCLACKKPLKIVGVARGLAINGVTLSQNFMELSYEGEMAQPLAIEIGNN